MTEQSATDTPVPATATRVRPARRKVGLKSKFLVAGASLGATMTLVGAMTFAAQQTAAAELAPEPAAAVQRVVVLPQALPETIVVVVPGAVGAPAARTFTVEPPAMPEPPAATPAPAAPAPVTESSGS